MQGREWPEFRGVFVEDCEPQPHGRSPWSALLLVPPPLLVSWAGLRLPRLWSAMHLPHSSRPRFHSRSSRQSCSSRRLLMGGHVWTTRRTPLQICRCLGRFETSSPLGSSAGRRGSSSVMLVGACVGEHISSSRMMRTRRTPPVLCRVDGQRLCGRPLRQMWVSEALHATFPG